MGKQVDLRELAIDRGEKSTPAVRGRRPWLTRYALPGVLLAGFLTLVAWAAWDMLFPPRSVTVVPVFATQSETRVAQTPLFQAAGWIEPRPTPVRVAALAPGVVQELLVVENQAVAAGEPVARLVADDARLACERAEADLKLREAELQSAIAARVAAQTRYQQPVHLEASLAEAEAALAKTETELKNLPFATQRAEAEWKLAKSDHEGKVASKGVVAGVRIDEARRTLDSAEALLGELRERRTSLKSEEAALRHRRDSLKTQLTLLADEIKAKDEATAQSRAAESRVAQARVALEEARLRLDRMTVRSPIAGRVYHLIADPGTTLAGGMGTSSSYDGSTVVTLYRPDSLQVRVDVRFEDLPKVSLGQPVQIANPALSSPLMGKVLFVSSVTDIQKNTVEVKVEINSPPPVFRPDMLVDVTFLAPKTTTKEPNTSTQIRFFIPEGLIHQGDDGTYVWVADQSERVARKVPVDVGEITSDGLIEIKGRVNAASRIVASPTEGLDDGERIHVAGEATSLDSSNLGSRKAARRKTLNRLPQGGNP